MVGFREEGGCWHHRSGKIEAISGEEGIRRNRFKRRGSE